MNENTVQNAVITGTKLGVTHTDHGILSFYIYLDYGGSGQGFGGWTLDNVPDAQGRRTPTTLGSSLLLGIDDLFGCNWEDLRGESCRAYGHHSKVIALGHYLKDKWLWMRHTGDDYGFVVTTFAEIKE